MIAFDDAIQIKKDQILLDTTQWHNLYVLDLDAHAYDSSPHTDFTPNDDNGVAFEKDDLHKNAAFEPLDNLVGAEALLSCGGENTEAVVVKCVKGLDGKPLGKYNTNPLLDTQKYLVKCKPGEEDEFMANAVAENIYSQVGLEGQQFQMMEEDIIEWRSNDDALDDDEESTVLLYGKRHPIATTKGWSFLVQWKRGEATWVLL